MGRRKDVSKVEHRADSLGLIHQVVSMGGKWHSPESKDLAQDMVHLCERSSIFSNPEANQCLVPVRSNTTGEIITEGSFIPHIAASLWNQVAWQYLMSAVAEEVKHLKKDMHEVALFGLGDCVPKLAFARNGIKTKTFDVFAKVKHDQALFQPLPINEPTVHEPSIIKEPLSDYPKDAIAVTGVACRFPGSDDLQELWELLLSGSSRVEEVKPDRIDFASNSRLAKDKAFKGEKLYGNLLDNPFAFDHSFFSFNPREAASMDPQTRMLLMATYQALESSGYLPAHCRESGDDVGVFMSPVCADYYEHNSSHPPNAYMFTGTLRATICGRISHFMGWTGPSETIDTACASSLVAINRACKAIQCGECSMAVAGSANYFTSPNIFIELSRAGFLSHTGQCKPFDAKADGFCRGEGVGVIVLKPLASAVKSNDNILGVIRAVGVNQSGLAPSLTVPHGPTQQKLLRRVLRESRLSPHDISYMEAHGTGTSVGDPIEMSSIRDTFGGPSRRENLTIGSIKGNIGHTEGTAGVAGVIKALLIIQKKILPPQASFSSLNPTIEPLEPDKLEISTKPKPWTANGQGICVSSYGAGGCNAAAIVTPGPDMTASNSNRSSNGLYPFIVSADCTESVHKMGQKLLDFFSKSRVQDDLGDIAFTLANKRRLGPWRSCFLAGTEGELVASLQKLTHNQLIAPSIPKKVVLAFAGQNARSMHIDRRLIDTPSAFRTNFLACNDAMLQLGLPNMYSSIFNDTVNQSVVQLHCNTFAIQYSSAMAWIDCGLQVECVVGHSFGELTALAVSGILSLEDAIRVISGRAVAIENKWGPEHGAMMLINDTFINVRNLISSRKENLEIACLNAEKGQVVVGSHEAINCLDRDLQNSSIRYKLLDISHGYHSQLADPILADLERVAHKVKFSKPRLHFEACTSSPPESIDASHIVRHTREPVYFLEAVRRIEERCGPCTWVEAGFNTSIINLVKNAVEKSQESIFHNFTTSNKTEPMSTVAEATIKLWQEGLSLSYWNFQVHDHGYKQIWLPPYQFNLTTHVLPRLDPGFAHTEEVSNASEEVQKPSKDLVIPHGTINRDDTSWHLRMNTSSPRFKALVEGHVVAKSPLCPASAYIEAVVHAVALLMGNEAKEMAPYSFEDVSMGLPLTTSQNGLVLIALQQLDDRGSIGFSIYTDEGSAACSSTAYHAKGTFKCPRALENSMELDFQTMHRLVYRNVRSLLENDDAEVLRNKKCYQIFDRVVKYSEMLRVIQKLRTFESNAVGDVITPDLDEPSSSQIQEICDAATVDGIVQVLGLLINSSELCSQEEVLVAVGIDRFEVSSSCKFNVGSHWQVYATVDPLLNETKGDVLVFDASDSLVLVATGVKFQKNKLSQFEKLLASMTGEASTRRQSSAKGESRKLSGQREYSESPHRMTRPSRSNGTPSRKESLQGAEPHNAVLGKDNDDAFRPFDRTQKLEAQSSPPQDRGLQHRSESIEAEIEGKLSGETPRLLEEVSDDSEPSDGLRERYMEIVADISGISVEDISMDSTFEDLGLNSLSLMEVSSDIEAELSIELDKDVIKHDTTVQELLDKLGQLFKLDSKSGGAEFDEDATSVEVPNDTNIKLDEPSISDRTPLPDSVAEPVSLYPQVEASSVYVNGEAATSSDFHRAISDCNKEFDFVARKHAFDGYWDKVSPAQNRLVVQYIVEAFEELGVDLKKLQPHDKIPEVECLRKYRDLVSRLYGYLTEAGILRRGNDGSYSRSRKDISAEKSMDLGKSLLLDFSEYFSEISLLNTTGPHLANCLMGKTDPLKLLFGNSKSLQVLDEYYTNSPQAGTTNDLFLEFFKSYEPCHATDELRILEIGAGFGGTTNRLAKFFQKSGRNVSYYFTDVSPTLVRDSQKKYSQYPWIKFQTLDLAADPPDSLREEFDVVIGTNVVHATSNTVLALEHVNSLLKDNGVVILSEITKMLHWADLVFGLLDGWWAFRDGRDYPFQTTEAWFRDLSRAGFGECEATGGKTTESTTQPLIVGVKRPAQCPKALSQIQTQLREKSQRLTVPYKMSESGEILADIYLPRRVGSSKNLPIGKN